MLAVWLTVVSLAVCKVRHAVKDSTLNRIAIGVSNVDVQFFMLGCFVFEFVNKGLLGQLGVRQGRDTAFDNRVAQTDRSAFIKATDASALPTTTSCAGDPITVIEFADKDAAGGVVAVVACVDADALKARDEIQQGEQSTELGRDGELQFVPAEGDATLGMLGVGDYGRLDGVAEELAVDVELAESLGGCECVTDESK